MFGLRRERGGMEVTVTKFASNQPLKMLYWHSQHKIKLRLRWETELLPVFQRVV